MKKLYYLYNTSNKELVNLRLKRAILLVMFLIVVILLFDAISAFGTDKFDKSNCNCIYIEVQNGDTLLDIAQEYAPANTDVYTYADFLMSINDLDDSKLFAGQKILIRRSVW
ncbi:MAG: LysM peptidoglycan-binding domain-containing protein [Eubacteriales bacterium]